MATKRTLHTATDLAVQFQMDIRTVNKYLEGVEPDEVRGGIKRYYLKTAAPRLLEMDVMNPQRQRAELDAARTKKLDMEIARLEGSLIPVDEAKRVIAEITSRARARLLALPGAQASRANPEDPKRAEAAIRDGVYDALIELADDPFGGGAVAPAPEAEGEPVGGQVSETEPGVERSAGSVED